MPTDMPPSVANDPAVIRANHRYRMALLGVTVVTALLMILGLVFLIDIAQTNRDNGRRLIDCTTPDGQCYREGQQRTADAVQQLIDEFQRQHDEQTNQLLREIARLLLKPEGSNGQR